VTVDDSAGTVVHLMGQGDGSGGLSPGAAVTVAMDTPYVLASADSPVRVATYTDTATAMQALADVLTGRATAPGRSPVTVSGLPVSACAS
jgi:beta-N-acetylhexosaminidase